MFTIISKTTFSQQPSNSFPTRNKTIVYDFCHEFKAKSSWVDLTDDAEITLPKNVSIKDENGNSYSIENVNIGGFSSSNPAFLRGDKVIIQAGYSYYNDAGNEVNTLQTIFTGYISEVTSKKPFVLKLEDNMFKLKQVQATGGNKNFFSGNKYTVEKM